MNLLLLVNFAKIKLSLKYSACGNDKYIISYKYVGIIDYIHDKLLP